MPIFRDIVDWRWFFEIGWKFSQFQKLLRVLGFWKFAKFREKSRIFAKIQGFSESEDSEQFSNFRDFSRKIQIFGVRQSTLEIFGRGLGRARPELV